MEEPTEKDKEKVCKRCKALYFPSSNNSSACRFHPSMFVCRRHDDQKRYYELGPDDPPYAAKFYDCCGAEEPEAAGCTYRAFMYFLMPGGMMNNLTTKLQAYLRRSNR